MSAVRLVGRPLGPHCRSRLLVALTDPARSKAPAEVGEDLRPLAEHRFGPRAVSEPGKGPDDRFRPEGAVPADAAGRSHSTASTRAAPPARVIPCHDCDHAAALHDVAARGETGRHNRNDQAACSACGQSVTSKHPTAARPQEEASPLRLTSPQGRRRGAGAGLPAGGFLAAALRTGLASPPADAPFLDQAAVRRLERLPAAG
jgi:hypothetical protein